MEQVKIQVGRIYMNKTRKYLFPIIKLYGQDFTFRINEFFKVGVGIGDILVEKCGFIHEKHLFILIDSKFEPAKFKRNLERLRQHPAYEDDYVFGHVTKSRFHMLVIKIPEQYYPTLQNFKESKFSKMYSIEDVRKLFAFENRTGRDKELYESAYKVLVHDHNYRVEFAKKIRDEFKVENFTVNDIGTDVEYDLPISKIEEIFNLKQHEEDLEI